ncbi:hypothetical protein BaRGS_00023889 [Batillaria attramentaria]|uniref:Uncharacterized protein n=1 Tax=Batillaria attramentaria TaxID=370345 RepID=A0ABD0KCP1_9CAEN
MSSFVSAAQFCTLHKSANTRVVSSTLWFDSLLRHHIVHLAQHFTEVSTADVLRNLGLSRDFSLSSDWAFNSELQFKQYNTQGEDSIAIGTTVVFDNRFMEECDTVMRVE